MTTKEQFIEMAKGITRPGIDQMMAWLETTDFYTAPASTRFHGAEEGGLCAHIPSPLQSGFWRLRTCGHPISIPVMRCLPLRSSTTCARFPPKYDDDGIRRDGINPLTHNGYNEEEMDNQSWQPKSR